MSVGLTLPWRGRVGSHERSECGTGWGGVMLGTHALPHYATPPRRYRTTLRVAGGASTLPLQGRVRKSGLRFGHIQQRLALRPAREIAGECVGDAAAVTIGRGRAVRDHQHVGQIPKARVGRQRLDLEHVEIGAGDFFGLKCRQQIRLLDDLAARDVDYLRLRIAMPGVFSRPIAAPEAESWLMMALRVRTLPPLLRRFVELVRELNGRQTAAPERVPSKALREPVAALSRAVRARRAVGG